jgi:hypothetical protein
MLGVFFELLLTPNIIASSRMVMRLLAQGTILFLALITSNPRIIILNKAHVSTPRACPVCVDESGYK